MPGYQPNHPRRESSARRYSAGDSGLGCYDVAFTGRNLRGLFLNRENVNGLTLEACDLTRASLRGTHASNTRFTKVTAETIAISGCCIEDSQWTAVDLRGGAIMDTSFRYTSLHGCAFRNVTLEDVSFADATLSDVSFVDAHLDGVDFTNATFRNVVITPVQLASCTGWETITNLDPALRTLARAVRAPGDTEQAKPPLGR